MKQMIAIAVGGAVGSLLRYGASNAVHLWMTRSFPYGTLVVNVSGCLVMGILYVLLIERLNLGPEWRAALLVGLLGGYTTFSSFSMETLLLFENGEHVKAFANIILSVSLCLAAVWLGVAAGRRL